MAVSLRSCGDDNLCTTHDCRKTWWQSDLVLQGCSSLQTVARVRSLHYQEHTFQNGDPCLQKRIIVIHRGTCITRRRKRVTADKARLALRNGFWEALWSSLPTQVSRILQVAQAVSMRPVKMGDVVPAVWTGWRDFEAYLPR